MHSFSFGELALIFGIIIVLFGGSRLASIGKSLGEGIANFKKGMNNANGTSAEENSQPDTSLRRIENQPLPPQNPSNYSENRTTTAHSIVDAETTLRK